MYETKIEILTAIINESANIIADCLKSLNTIHSI